MALKAKQVYGALTSEVKSIVSGIASWSVDDVNKTITAVTNGGQTLTIHFTQPSDGVGVDSVDLVDGHIIVTYTDTTTHDAGVFPIPTIEVGTTETVEPTEPAEVTAEDTATGIKLNFKIPRGESGGDADFIVSSLPVAAAAVLGKTYLLSGTQTGYETGGIYKCILADNVYSWLLINGEPATITTAAIDALFD